MPDTEISKLVELVSKDIQGTDPLAIADLSAVETKKVTVKSLIEKGVDILSPDAIDPDKIDWDSQAANQINGSAIKDRSIAAGKLVANTLTAAEIAPNAIGASELANGAVDTAALQDSAVTASKVAADQIGDQHIIPGGLGSNSIADGAVTRVKMTLNANDIDGSVIADNTLTANELAPNSVGSSELANNAVDTNAIQARAVTADKIADDQIGDQHIVTGGLGTASIANGAITRAKMTLNANDIDGSVIADNTISANEIGPNAVGASELADNSVDTAALQNVSVTEPKIADDAIRTRHIAPAQIGTAELANSSVTNVKLSDLSVSTEKLIDDSVTADKLANELPGSILGNGEIDTAQLANDAVTTAKIADLAVTTDKLGSSAVTDAKVSNVSGAKLLSSTVTADKLSATAFSGGIELDGTVQHTNNITAGTSAGITWDANGHVTGFGTVPSSDLPLATATTVGAISVPTGSGLTVSGAGAIDHITLIDAGSVSGFTYDEHGHITATRALIGSDLPAATSTTLGAVSIPNANANPLSITGDGELTHAGSNITAGTYVSLYVDRYGHVQSGDVVLAVNQVPNLPADKITTGQFPTARIADGSITAPKHADYATCLMQESLPATGDYLGQLWYTPSTAQLRVYARGSGPENIWLPVGFGLLQQQNLRFAFTFDASTSTITSITQYGAPLGLAVGDAIPSPTDPLAGAYGVCVVEGNGITLHDVNGDNFTIGDWILCAGEVTGWQHIDIAEGAGGGGAQFLNDLLDVDTTLQDVQDGQILKYNGNIGQWVNVPDNGTAAIGNTPPSNAPLGALWWDTESGRLMVYYDDGDTTQWVVATPESGLTGGFPPTLPTLKVLNDLDDVEAGKFDGVLLQYNAGNLRWESTGAIDSGTWAGIREMAVAPALPRSDQPKNLNDLDDVNAVNTDKAFLQYDGGSSTWMSQDTFDGGLFGVTKEQPTDYVAESFVGTRDVKSLNDFQDVNAAAIDQAYLIYNDNLNYWQETTIINGGNF